MDILRVPLPKDARQFVDDQATENGLESGEDYVRDLVLREQAKRKLRDLLMEGANSPPAGPADDAYFERLRARVSNRATKRV